MSPFASARVIPTAWSAHHRPVVAGTRTATCTITTAGTDSAWTPETGMQPGTRTTVHTGTCRVQALDNAPDAADAAAQDVTASRYLVVVDHDAPEIALGARVHIDTCPDDARLVAKTLTVKDSRHASLRWERDLICELDQSNQTP